MAEQVVVEDEGGVRVIRINRPQARNAIDLATSRAMAQAFDELDAREDLRVGVLTGEGGYFSAGMDLKAFRATGERPIVPGRGLGGLNQRPPATPLIAAVEGFALGGGFEMVLACDLVVTASDAVMGLPEVRRGLLAAGGGLLRLPERIPVNVAMELALTGEPMSAERAHALGLVNRVTPPGGALAEALTLAGQIAHNAPLAVRRSKQIIRQAPDWLVGDAFEAQRALADEVLESADAKEGALAFAERRSPRWTGR